ncbi:MAG: Glu-tRNA(Gln) amidotransferase subunit GatE, partial [Candidatus Diapherotrites archaeon]|nr:Glu-tRNA(Gln) amidotransferase subunit GatE [Candidatus Diapherotrites archaeon]
MGIDYKAVGLKCGLECHQQLDTKKLFCSCPSILTNKNAEQKVRRYLFAAASELGEFDRAALQAVQRGLSYEYEYFDESCCLVELDEEPPHTLNKEALKVALQVAMMLNSTIVDKLIVMRKIVVDGSNVSAFQRTLLIAKGGYLEVNNKRIGIQTVVLEEDAARPSAKTEKSIIYKLDRLGVPLIEIATAPDITTPSEAKIVALKIGEVLRRTCKAKRGLGTIRQDLNISIANGARVEIKGVQDLQIMDKVVEYEVQRQLALIEIKEILNKKSNVKLIKEEFVDITPLLSDSNSNLIKKNIAKGNRIFALPLPGFSGILGKELQPGRRFGTELADYVRAYTNLQGIIHSDELPGYGISEAEKNAIFSKLRIDKSKDAFVVVIGREAKAKQALKIVLERCRTAFIKVPEETRNALEDGTSSFSRPLPGSARMYPETDIPTIEIDEKLLKELKKNLPKTVEERVQLYRKHGLSEKLTNQMKLSNYACFFEELLEEGFNATTAATLLLDVLPALKRKGIAEPSKDEIKELLIAEQKGKIEKSSFAEIIEEAQKIGISNAIKKYEISKRPKEFENI